MSQPIRLYCHPVSGHAHRVELFLSLLDVPFEKVLVNLPAREQKSPEFLAKNAFGQVPVIEDAGLVLADSTAILVYLAKRYDTTHSWLPDDPVGAARVQRWLSVASGQLVQGPALARAAVLFRRAPDTAACERAQQLLSVVEAELVERDFLLGSTATLADVAMYTYTAHVPEGGVSLEPYPSTRAWLGRIEALTGFVPMARNAAPGR